MFPTLDPLHSPLACWERSLDWSSLLSADWSGYFWINGSLGSRAMEIWWGERAGSFLMEGAPSTSSKMSCDKLSKKISTPTRYILVDTN